MNWIIGNWNNLLPSPLSSIALAVVAALCGAIVGAERERKDKPTGLRTLTMVALGSAVFTMISFGPAAALTPLGNRSDVGRIAAQIVSGVGFLGAGVILRGRFGVAGMTSAATIWAVAAVGMLVGAGYAGGGLGLSLFILALLTTVSQWELRWFGKCRYAKAKILFDSQGGKTSIRIQEILEEYRVSPAMWRETFPAGDSALENMEIDYCFVHRRHREFLVALAELPEVREIKREESGG